MGEGKIGLVMDVSGEEDHSMCLTRSLSPGFLSDCSRFAKWRWKYGWRRWNVGYRLVPESISVEGVVVREFKA